MQAVRSSGVSEIGPAVWLGGGLDWPSWRPLEAAGLHSGASLEGRSLGLRQAPSDCFRLLQTASRAARWRDCGPKRAHRRTAEATGCRRPRANERPGWRPEGQNAGRPKAEGPKRKAQGAHSGRQFMGANNWLFCSRRLAGEPPPSSNCRGARAGSLLAGRGATWAARSSLWPRAGGRRDAAAVLEPERGHWALLGAVGARYESREPARVGAAREATEWPPGDERPVKASGAVCARQSAARTGHFSIGAHCALLGPSARPAASHALRAIWGRRVAIRVV